MTRCGSALRVKKSIPRRNALPTAALRKFPCRGLQPACPTLIPVNDSQTCSPGPKGAAARREEHAVRHGEHRIPSPFSAPISIHARLHRCSAKLPPRAHSRAGLSEIRKSGFQPNSVRALSVAICTFGCAILYVPGWPRSMASTAAYAAASTWTGTKFDGLSE